MNSFKLMFFIFFVGIVSCKKEKKESVILRNEDTKEEQVITKTTLDSVSEKREEKELINEQTFDKKEVKKEGNSAQLHKVNETDNKTVQEVIEVEKLQKPTSEKAVVQDNDPVEEIKEEVKKQNLIPEIYRINSLEFKSKITAKEVQLVDVRTPKEYANERLEGAVNINYYEGDLFRKKMAKLDKSEPVYVYCKSGIRSSRSAKILKKAGFKVYDLKGGIKDWKSNKFKVVK